MIEKFKFGAFVIIIFVFLLLLLKKDKQKSDLLLLFWCAIFGIHLITINFQSLLPKSWFYLNEVLSYLHGFILYGYMSINLKEEIPFRKLIIHIISLVIGSFLVLLLTGGDYWKYPLVIITVKGIVTIAYIFLAFSKFNHQNIPQRNWYLFLAIGLIILTLIPFLVGISNYDRFLSGQNMVGNIAYCFFILILGFFGIGIEPVFINKYKEETTESKPSKYALSNLSEEQRIEIFNELEKIIEEEKLYTYTNLSIGILSTKTGHNSSRISESINHVANCNFNDYINQKRIEAFKAKIEKGYHQQKTILSIAFDCGFNSKTSFNRAFKKLMKITPSQFIRTKS